jgi:hypothetical protein
MGAAHKIIWKKQIWVYGTPHSAWHIPNGFLKLDVFAF